MKRLLVTIFIISSLTGFSQEKGPICSGGCSLFHPTDPLLNSYDNFRLSGGSLDHVVFSGAFQADSITSDSLIYEITLVSGDSLIYSASWLNDGGPCYIQTLEPEDTDSVVTILEGTPFPITIFEPSGYSGFSFAISQKGIVRNSCLIQFKAAYLTNPQKTLVRVKFVDPTLGIPDISNEFSLWLSGENKLSVKADQDAVWEMTLYSLSGQVIQKNNLEGSQDLDISNLPKGCYIARVSNGNGLEKQLKFIR